MVEKPVEHQEVVKDRPEPKESLKERVKNRLDARAESNKTAKGTLDDHFEHRDARRAHEKSKAEMKPLTKQEAIDIAKQLRLDQGRSRMLKYLGEPEGERHTMENLSDGKENRPEKALIAADHRGVGDPDNPDNAAQPSLRDRLHVDEDVQVSYKDGRSKR